jgi:outer membrane lipoprotein SlyB
MNRIFKIALAAALASSTLALTASEGFAASKKQYCSWQADRAARRAAGESVGTGAALGAGAGGLFGGITGHGAGSNIVTGLALGAVGGAIVGGASSQQHAKEVYWDVYHDCMGY